MSGSRRWLEATTGTLRRGGLGDIGSPAGTAPLAEEPAQVFRGLVRVTVALVVLQTVLHLLNAGLDLQVDRLNADNDRSLWSWAGSASQLVAALGVGLMLVLQRAPRKAVIFLTLVLAFFSLDDAVQVHEQLSHVLEGFAAGSSVPPRMVWPALYAPLMLITFLLLWWFSAAMNQRCRRALRIGLVMLGVAVLLEFGVGTVSLGAGDGEFDTVGAGSMLYQYEVGAEEGLELGGWLLVATALVTTALDRLVRQVRRGP